MIIYLGPAFPRATIDLPESQTKRAASPLLFGLSPGGVYLAAPVAGGTGELLPHHFTLTAERAGGGIFSVALSLGLPPLGVTQHPALWSSDFPRTPRRGPRSSCPLRRPNLVRTTVCSIYHSEARRSKDGGSNFWRLLRPGSRSPACRQQRFRPVEHAPRHISRIQPQARGPCRPERRGSRS